MTQKTPSPEMNRETWLAAAVEKLQAAVFRGEVIPNVRVSTGFPHRGGTSQSSKTIGQCWAPEAAADARPQIFISPILADSVRVLDVLCHELVHAIVGNAAGHRGPFKRLATHIGLEGKMTATTASFPLKVRLNEIITELGEYPHAELTPSLSGRKKDGTRMLKFTCPECGYVIRTTQKWVDVGLPTCVCGAEFINPNGEEINGI